MPKVNLSAVTITELVDHLEGQRRRIDEQLLELRGILGTANGSTSPTAHTRGGKRQLSPATRQRIATAQKKRWAASRAATTTAQATAPAEHPVPVATGKPKRTLSAAGRKRIVAALKKRWADKKAAEAASKKPKTMTAGG